MVLRRVSCLRVVLNIKVLVAKYQWNMVNMGNIKHLLIVDMVMVKS